MDFLLGTPEHNHAISNHLPLIGYAAALLPILLGLVLRNVVVLRTGLLIAVVFGATTGLVMGSGEEAKERFIRGEVPNVAIDAESMAILEHHDEQAHLTGKVSYAATALAALALIISFWRRKWTLPASAIVGVFILGSLVLLAQAAKSGGQIRHPEFRQETPAAVVPLEEA